MRFLESDMIPRSSYDCRQQMISSRIDAFMPKLSVFPVCTCRNIVTVINIKLPPMNHNAIKDF